MNLKQHEISEALGGCEVIEVAEKSSIAAHCNADSCIEVHTFFAGGPAMIRAAAKNHAHVSVCVDPEDYGLLLTSLGGSTDSPDARTFRQRLAWKAYQHCASYDTAVAEWLWQQIGAQEKLL